MSHIRVHTSQLLESGTEIELDPGPARHLVQVLRQRAGQQVALFNGDGSEYQAEILAARRPDHCRLRLGRQHRPQTESPLEITLIQAIGRGERMDWAIQKSVELGVTAIRPVFTERTQVRLDARRAASRLAHWQQVAIAACEQSGRTRIPEIAEPMPLVDLPPCPGTGLSLDPEASTGLSAVAKDRDYCLAVGPEGGLTEPECRWLAERGFQAVRAGPRILRTETAGVAVLAALQALFGDWR